MGFDRAVDADRTRIHGRGMGVAKTNNRSSNISSDSLFSSVSDDNVFLDAEGHIQTWNERAERIWGYTSDEIVGEHLSIFYREEDVTTGIPDRLLREAATEGQIRAEGWRVRKDGTELWEHVILTAYYEYGEVVGYAMSTRETTQHQREQNLLEEQKRLESLITSISHDLRNPLSVAHGNAKLLKETRDLSHVEKITEALTRTTELLNHLEQLATEGKQIQEPAPTELREVAEAAWNVIQTDRAGLTVEGEMTLMADRQRLQELLENLFRNAVEHAGPDVTVSIGPLETDGFYVEDDGPGISEADRISIFEGGYSGNPDSSGFGLAICRQIASAHRWSIDVADRANGGVRFEITGVDGV